MASGVCYFTDKLPLELRREIYRYVLQQDEPIATNLDSLSLPTPIDLKNDHECSLFRVNKIIARECEEVFFECNTIHLPQATLKSWITVHGHALHSLSIGAMCSETFKCSITMLTDFAHEMPKLKAVTFDCSRLGLSTVRGLIEEMEPVLQQSNKPYHHVANLQCVTVGQYTFPIPELKTTWTFQYPLLSEIWQYLSEKPERFNMDEETFRDGERPAPAALQSWMYGDEAARKAGGRDYRSSAQDFNTDFLALAVAAYAPLEKLLPADDVVPDEVDLRALEDSIGLKFKDRWVQERCLKFAKNRKLLRSVRAEDDAEVKEWAAELLAPNVRDLALHQADEWAKYDQREV